MHTKLIALLVAVTVGGTLVTSGCAHNSHLRANAQAQNDYQVQRIGNLEFVTGGVGVTSRKAMRALPSNYNLRLIFSQKPRRAYVAKVDVEIKDQQGHTLLHAPSDGPWLFAEVPPGTYQVVASTSGHKLEKTVTVGSTPTIVNLISPP